MAKKLSSFARDLADTMLYTTTECGFDSIVRALAIWKWNGVIVPSQDNSGDLGTVIYMINTALSHSCRPNAIQVINSSLRMQVTMSVEQKPFILLIIRFYIKRFDGISGGQPVTISRIPDICRRNLRRRILQNRFNLKCACKLCEIEKRNTLVDYTKLNANFLAASQIPFYTDELLVLAKGIMN